MSRPTCIKSIKIENIQGIQSRTFKFHTPELFANKIHLLVAPNSFGKSSIAHAFDCVKPRSLDLAKLRRHKDDPNAEPKIELTYTKENREQTLNERQIGVKFSISVIKSRISPKVRQANPTHAFGRASATEEVTPITICSIPARPTTPITQARIKPLWGSNCKILPDCMLLFKCSALVAKILKLPQCKKFSKDAIWTRLQPLIDDLNQQTGTSATLTAYLKANLLARFANISEIAHIASEIRKSLNCSEEEGFLYGVAFGLLYRNDKRSIEENQARTAFEDSEQEAKHLLNCVNSNPEWLSVNLRKTGGNLVATFPPATSMSSGQRDLFSFICQLVKARFDLSKDLSILIIDEVFDYLDECNLLLAQYFIREYVNNFREAGKELFPLVLTHLDPLLFNHAGFGKKNKLQVHLLDNDHHSDQLNGVAKLVKAREDDEVKQTIEKHFFHYEPTSHNAISLFTDKSLPLEWAESHAFYDHAQTELEKYKDSDDSTDFIAACVGLRLHIEKCAFDQLTNEEDKTKFTDECTTGTNSKLEFCSSKGFTIPETHRILGLIYNDMLHYKKNFDYISAIISKMKNPAIRTMIMKAIEG